MQKIFQDPASSLNPRFTVYDAISEPLKIRGYDAEKARELTVEMTCAVGLGKDDLKRYTSEFSGGQQQRIAIARALINSPEILLADEPTGNLDVHNSMEIMELLEEINRRGTTVLVVTHSREIVAEMGKRVITLTRGVLTGDQKGGIWHEN